MTVKAFPLGDYWDAVEYHDVTSFHTRIHHGRVQIVFSFYGANAYGMMKRQMAYIDPSQVSVEVCEED